MGGMFYSKGGGADMSTKQKAIAAKAPPPEVLDGKDFAVLREEKVKSGKVKKAFMGLAVEAMKKAKDKGAKPIELLSPIAMAKRFFNKGGKVIKANTGVLAKMDKFKKEAQRKIFLEMNKKKLQRSIKLRAGKD
jgi:hypothetical protein